MHTKSVGFPVCFVLLVGHRKRMGTHARFKAMQKILIIEDNRDIRENAVEMLELAGYPVISAPDGLSGIKMAREEMPDLILCDIMMPGATGFEVYHAMKADVPTSSIPFVFVTASVERKEMNAALDMGVNDYLRKPFAEDELLEVVAKFIGKP